MAFYDFPLQMLKRVKESRDLGTPIMSLEKCVWRLTKEQGDWFGLDVGHLQEGKRADIVVLDPVHFYTVQSEPVKDVFHEFGGFVRLVNRNANLVKRVLVGGKVIYENDEFVEGYGTKNKYGKFLKKQAK